MTSIRAMSAGAKSESGSVNGLARRLTRALSSNPLVRWSTGAVVLLILIILVLPALVDTSPTELAVGPPLAPPSASHWFGTDQLGRDVLSRVLYGARISLTIAPLAAAIALVVGGTLGAVAASSRGRTGELIMRSFDVILAFPGILLAIVLASAIGPSMTTTVIVLAVIYSPSMARVVRAAVFSEFGEDYVTAARLLGTSRIRLVGYHIGRNAALPVMVYVTLVMADAIVAEAALSFLGAGIRPPAPSWGNVIHDGQSVLEAGAWWLSLFPGLAIVLAVLGLNRFSEVLGRRMRS